MRTHVILSICLLQSVFVLCQEKDLQTATCEDLRAAVRELIPEGGWFKSGPPAGWFSRHCNTLIDRVKDDPLNDADRLFCLRTIGRLLVDASDAEKAAPHIMRFWEKSPDETKLELLYPLGQVVRYKATAEDSNTIARFSTRTKFTGFGYLEFGALQTSLKSGLVSENVRLETVIALNNHIRTGQSDTFMIGNAVRCALVAGSQDNVPHVLDAVLGFHSVETREKDFRAFIAEFPDSQLASKVTLLLCSDNDPTVRTTARELRNGLAVDFQKPDSDTFYFDLLRASAPKKKGTRTSQNFQRAIRYFGDSIQSDRASFEKTCQGKGLVFTVEERGWLLRGY